MGEAGFDEPRGGNYVRETTTQAAFSLPTVLAAWLQGGGSFENRRMRMIWRSLRVLILEL